MSESSLRIVVASAMVALGVFKIVRRRLAGRPAANREFWTKEIDSGLTRSQPGDFGWAYLALGIVLLAVSL